MISNLTSLFIMLAVFSGAAYSQIKPDGIVNLNVDINTLGFAISEYDIQIIVNYSDTLFLSPISSSQYQISLSDNHNNDDLLYSQLLITERKVSNVTNAQVKSPYFLLDSSIMNIEWELASSKFISEGGRESEVFNLFQEVDLKALKDITNLETDVVSSEAIDSLRFEKVTRELELIRKFNDTHISYDRLLSLFRPSFYPRSEEIGNVLAKMDTNFFNQEKLNALNSRYKIYQKEMYEAFDKSFLPQFSSKSYNSDVTFDELIKQYDFILIDIWATWCVPCLAQHPTIDSLYRVHRDSNSFTIVGLAISSNEKQWNSYLSNGSITYPNFHLDEDATEKLTSSIDIVEVPRYALLRTSDHRLVESYIDFRHLNKALIKYNLIK